MHGLQLKCLFVDLSERTTRLESIGEKISMMYLGGRGIGAYLLSNDPTSSPLDPDTPLIFSTGPLTGSRIPSSGRMMISSYSPITDTITSSSVGGNFAIHMKRAGIDVIHITGLAKRPLMLHIQDHNITFEDIDMPDEISLTDMFSKTRSMGSTAAIGRAALNGCLFASIMIDGVFASGRGGLGLVMASKNLRAITVKGSKRPYIKNRSEETKAVEDILRLFDASPAIMGRSGIIKYGTSCLVDLMASRHMMPTANFRRTFFDAYQAFSAFSISSSLDPSHYGCYACPVKCKQKASDQREIPEFETLSHFGALNENPDLESIIEANSICNDAGMDTITAGATIACLAEIREERYRGETLVEKVREMASGSRDGELLQLGSRRLAEELNVPGVSMSVKSLEMPAYDPRGAYGMALAYCTSTRGACHLRAYPISHEILRKPVATDRFSFSGKARIIKIAEDLNAIIDSIGACKFAFFGASIEEYAHGLRAVTGLELEAQDLLSAGDRVYTLERYINSLRGFGKKDDYLPERFYTEPGTPGAGIDIPPVDKTIFEETLNKYYSIRGCDKQGMPSEARLKELEII